MFTKTYHIVYWMEDLHAKISQHVQCVPRCLSLIRQKSIHKEGTGATIHINNRISWNVLHTSNTKLAFNSPYVCIRGTHQCGKERCGSFSRRGGLHDILCRRDYAEHVVSSFLHQIQLEYYVGKSSVYIEWISSYHFSVLKQPSTVLTSINESRQAVVIFLW